jgi:trimeric autotransporter adhesin
VFLEPSKFLGKSFIYTSDRRLKENIATLPDALEKILGLRGVYFDWKRDGKGEIGLIAQEVEDIYPDLVITDKKSGLKAVKYGNIVAPLIEAIKAQQKMIENQRKMIEQQ